MTVLRRPRAATTSATSTTGRRYRHWHRHRHRPWPLCRQCCGLALDMGSARTRAWIAGRGMILDVPTVTFPGALHPIQRGAIVDIPGTARLLDRLRSATACRASPAPWWWSPRPYWTCPLTGSGPAPPWRCCARTAS
ncbi:hypothetical protein GCM10010365_11980 [Streptomyces poonensis]|uniref:Uncharacterized protein n=1 Tax=Streptomyces poonensis TaxID=68255 RepID=A0A918UDZ5_9ACTN|nr:hypothetical protein GCM10010365_11980 [Streptomyces poonensis]GLJ88729.1 hypothetical protein GCM10017589_13290 [Streptomyces poonensis]